YYEASDFAVVDRITQIASKRGVNNAQVALAWVLMQPGVSAPIIGASKMQQLDDAVSALDIMLNGEEIHSTLATNRTRCSDILSSAVKKGTISRREFLESIAVSGGLIAAANPSQTEVGPQTHRRKASDSIDRAALVRRHNPVIRKLDPLSPLSLGNGEFAFTADITGLQTFPEAYEKAMPLCTMSQWGWHTSRPHAFAPASIKLTEYDTHGRAVGYATSAEGQSAIFN